MTLYRDPTTGDLIRTVPINQLIGLPYIGLPLFGTPDFAVPSVSVGGGDIAGAVQCCCSEVCTHDYDVTLTPEYYEFFPPPTFIGWSMSWPPQTCGAEVQYFDDPDWVPFVWWNAGSDPGEAGLFSPGEQVRFAYQIGGILYYTDPITMPPEP